MVLLADLWAALFKTESSSVSLCDEPREFGLIWRTMKWMCCSIAWIMRLCASESSPHPLLFLSHKDTIPQHAPLLWWGRYMHKEHFHGVPSMTRLQFCCPLFNHAVITCITILPLEIKMQWELLVLKQILTVDVFYASFFLSNCWVAMVWLLIIK